jgi:hypothetical protein
LSVKELDVEMEGLLVAHVAFPSLQLGVVDVVEHVELGEEERRREEEWGGEERRKEERRGGG